MRRTKGKAERRDIHLDPERQNYGTDFGIFSSHPSESWRNLLVVGDCFRYDRWLRRPLFGRRSLACRPAYVLTIHIVFTCCSGMPHHQLPHPSFCAWLGMACSHKRLPFRSHQLRPTSAPAPNITLFFRRRGCELLLSVQVPP
jgi:hypothetical protein